ncbi:isomerase [Alteromonadales bacterium alter-6D02]|nr:isomerase [Alteromonadales bacterium alter-6D02]
MTTLSIYQVDAFATRTFEGNPAAVIPLSEWLDDSILQKIAEENNLSETAFFVKSGEHIDLRWFTPLEEVDLCGHATLATAHVLYQHLGFQQQQVRFQTRSGKLVVTRHDNSFSMDFPATKPQIVTAPVALLNGLRNVTPKQVIAGFDYIVELGSEQELIDLIPDFAAWHELDRRGVVVTAKGEDTDFVSRCFYPKLRVNEDPVTGSAHCQLTPYWAEKLDKTQLTAKQLSTRGGELTCHLRGERVILEGRAVDYMRGEITIGTA